MRVRTMRRAIGLLLAVALSACGDKIELVQPPPPARVRRVVVSPDPASIRVSETLVMVATVEADSGVNTAVTWSSADPRHASVTANGIVTAVAEGISVITATSVADPTVTGHATITVTSRPTVRQINVQPLEVSLRSGERRTLAVGVVADDGVNTTLTFTSQAPAIAAISNDGVITAVSPGSTTVVVSSVANPSLRVNVAVTVRSPAPPLVSIQSITTGSTNTPVNLTNAVGQLDVTVNVQQGDDALVRVDLVASQNGRDTVVATQAFNAAFLEKARRAAVTSPSADSATQALALAPITLSFRSDAFDPNTGGVRLKNGAMQVRAVVIAGTGTTQQSGASNTVGMTLNNTDGFYVRMRTLTKTAIPSAADERGAVWFQAGNGIEVTSIPVLYSDRGVGWRTIAFPGGSPAGSITSTKRGIAVDTVPLTAFTSPNAGAAYVNGQLPSISAIDTLGNALTLVGPASTDGAGILNAQPNLVAGTRLTGIRVDNDPPPAGATFVISTAVQNSNNWVNGSYQFATGLAGIVGDPGVGVLGGNASPSASSVQAIYRVFGGALADTVTATTGADLAPTSVNSAYGAIARYNDRLGNARSVPLSGLAPNPASRFGVDLQPPQVRFATTPPAGQTIVSNFSDSVYTSTISSGNTLVYGIEALDDRAGFGATPVTVSLTLFSQPNPPNAFTGTTSCVIGVMTSGKCVGTPAAFASTLIDAFRQLTTPLDGGSAREGYYTYEAVVVDQAGNAGTVIRKRLLHDQGIGPSAPQIASIGMPALMRGGQPVIFSPIAADNVELTRGQLYVGYPNLPTTPMLSYMGLLAGTFPIGTAFDSLLTSPISGHANFTVQQFIRALEITDVSHAPQPYAAATVKPTSVNAVVRDVPNVTPASLAVNASILAASVEVPSGTPGFAALTGANQLVRWRPYAGGNSPLRFEAVGPSGQTDSPFARVILARLTTGVAPNAQVWHIISEITTATGIDNGLERVWRYDFGGQPSGSYVAIGVSAEGDAIATQVVSF